ncbi:hypothetical protein CGZ96_02595 [Enemella evansiae]|nr:hypothetical protein CGZ96_02595 [Enemella evansiae]
MCSSPGSPSSLSQSSWSSHGPRDESSKESQPVSTSNDPRGLVPVIQTPFQADGTIDLPSFDRLVDHTLSAGVGGVFFPGIASEFYQLDDAERGELTRRLLRRTNELPEVPAIVSITDQSAIVGVRRAREALEAGADMINIMAPRFWRLPAEAVDEYFQTMLAELAPAPMMIQYASDVSSVGLTPNGLRGWAEQYPNLSCVKVEVDRPGPFIADLVEGTPALGAFVGRSGLHLIDALEHGATGVQPVTGFIEVFGDILAEWDAGRIEEARRIFERLLPYLVIGESEPGLMIAVAKTITARRGIIDTDVCRAPSLRLAPDLLRQVDSLLEAFAELLSETAGVSA